MFVLHFGRIKLETNMTRPITTYGGRGCVKAQVSKWQHCIVFTGKIEPDPLPDELPKKDEQGMLSAVRISPTRRGDPIHPTSRTNFGKPYNVEHNVKVCDFGNIHRDHIQRLETHFQYVLSADVSGQKQDHRTISKDIAEEFDMLEDLTSGPKEWGEICIIA